MADTNTTMTANVEKEPIVNVTMRNDSPVIEVNLTVGESQSQFEIGDNLVWKNGKLDVNTAEVVEEDNTRPVTSAAVFTVTGNIEALLATL